MVSLFMPLPVSATSKVDVIALGLLLVEPGGVQVFAVAVPDP